jgi:hypothetical protein
VNFKVSAAITDENVVFCVVTPYSFVDAYQCFRGTCYLIFNSDDGGRTVLFNPKDVSSVFLRNVGIVSQNYTVITQNHNIVTCISCNGVINTFSLKSLTTIHDHC